MRKCLISRYGAYGDILHISHLPRLLKDQGFDVVDVETNAKGYEILVNNPFIDNLIHFEPSENIPMSFIEKHWNLISQGYDHFINLYKTLEYGVIAMEDTEDYYMSQSVRDARYSNANYYDVGTVSAGYHNLCGKYRGEVFFTEQEERIAKEYLQPHEGKFVVVLNLSGTGPHKELIDAREIADSILAKYPDAQIITTAGKEFKHLDFEGDRIESVVGWVPFRQILNMIKYVDLVIGCESGLMVGSNLFGTPTIQLMTAANLINHCKYAKNDFSIQSPAYCSPCFKGPYQYIGCPHKDGKPLCVFFDINEIMKNVEKVYELRQ